MVSQCANPECGAPFLYLRDGKLVAVRRNSESPAKSRVEFFWLCAECARSLNVKVAVNGGMSLVPRQPMLEFEAA